MSLDPSKDIALLDEGVRGVLAQTGFNRTDLTHCQLQAQTDVEAVYCWLNEYRHNPNTYRVYQREIHRLLLWCGHQQQKTLSDLKREDFDDYVNFLIDPEPKSFWCAPSHRGAQRYSKAWKPFTGGLSAKSRALALTVINTMLSYLVDAGYLQHNPLRLMKKHFNHIPSVEAQHIALQARILTPDEWRAILATLDNLNETTSDEKAHKYRLRFIVMMLYFLGLRVSELTSHSWSAFQQCNGLWWFLVRGKGGKLGKVPVHHQLWHEVIQFRLFLGMPAIPQPSETSPLVPAWRHANGLQPRQINHLLKSLAKAAAETIDNPVSQAKLKQFSAHWLRHLSATMQERAGIAFSYIKANHRHEKEETTRLYVHALDEERHQAMQRLSVTVD